MRSKLLAATLVAGLSPLRPPAAADEVDIQTARLRATISRGAICALADAKGTAFVRRAEPAPAARIHRIGGEHPADDTGGRHRVSERTAASVAYRGFAGLEGAAIDASFSIDGASGDLVVTQAARSPQPGIWGVSWSLGEIPADFSILVPGHSGLRLDADTPGDRHAFDYPMGWEAQLVVVQGRDRGFHVWAEDTEGRFKRLVASRTPGGWRLDFVSINDAPFDTQTAAASVRWRLNVHEGDWRVPARRYREWMRAHLGAVPLAEKSPAWARDIRACAITGMSLPLLDELAKHLDPPQTLLYVPDWRSAGYDRNYPDYDDPRPELGPFLERAHALGFRVMLHVNYFGVDPLHPLYKKFEPFHVRSPWGEHPHEWWTWDRAAPPIKFAYINPASAAWRKLFVSAMADLCRHFPIDALHLDQTLCIYNDHNGRIDGLSMVQGSVALHRELRAALPQVALSGEGLNEVTCREEAFAQRHVWGLNHADGTWSEARLRCAHPIASYLFLPFTTIYGYLGMAAPESGQLYAAWNAAYAHFGVIPTIRPSVERLKAVNAAGAPDFLNQFLDEARCWQGARLDPDLDGAWPADVVFPYRAAEGGQAARMADGRLLHGGRVVSRTLFGSNRVETPGILAGWLAYDESRLMGLDPARRYPCFDGRRDPERFHFSELPEGIVAEGFFSGPDLASIRTRGIRTTLAELDGLLWSAVCGVRPPRGEAFEAPGPLGARDGAVFHAEAGGLFAHPPWQGASAGGEAFARFSVQLPREERPRFVTSVALGPNSEGAGKSDGITFKVVALANGQRVVRELHHASETPAPLELDLSPLAGRKTEIELSVHPGPAASPSFDRARWLVPRIESDAPIRGAAAVAGPQHWALALDANGPAAIQENGTRHIVRAQLPGSIFLLATNPEPLDLPADLLVLPRTVAIGAGGIPQADVRQSGVQVAARSSGGVSRRALYAHPPDHGTTTVCFPLQLPRAPGRFAASVGLADGSKSDGVLFLVEANGREIARHRALPGGWSDIRADLAPWAGKPIVLSLTTDSDGSFYFDWALWGEPRIEAAR